MRIEQSGSKCWQVRGVFGDAGCAELAEFGHCRNCPAYVEAGRGLFERDMTAEALREWTNRTAAVKETEDGGHESVLVFRLGGEWLALPTAHLQEAAEIRPVHFVPFRSNPCFAGIVNISGELLPCVRLAELLGITGPTPASASDRPAHARMVVTGQGTDRFVFPVDEIFGILHLAPRDLQPAPATLLRTPQAIATGIFNLEGKAVGLLDGVKLIAAIGQAVFRDIPE